MLVEVTQKLIDHNELTWKKIRCRTCPVARAVNLLLKRGMWAAVMGTCFHIYKGDFPCQELLLTVKLPDFVAENITKLDHGVKVKPFDFEITIPEFLC